MKDKWGGATRVAKHMDEFKVAINFCGLERVDCVGDPFTWFRSPKNKISVKEKLDRFFISELHKIKVVKSVVNHLNLHHSDHRPFAP